MTIEQIPQTPAASGDDDPAAATGRRRPALSPSRAADFKRCPLLYRYRAIDRLPEAPSAAQARGILVHAALEQIYVLPAGERDRDRALDLLEPAWARLAVERPELAAAQQLADLLPDARRLLERYFTMEDPVEVQPQSCELPVEVELDGGLVLRGFVDRVDVSEAGALTVIDYKTGRSPGPSGETEALFQLKFYALVLMHLHGRVPGELRLLYLGDGTTLAYAPERDELERFERILASLWETIRESGATGEFPPAPGRWCNWCDHKARCPAFGGRAPAYPGWPEGVPSAQKPPDTE
ncbi:RecB family exonuclease [Speluncibacter jeojiensis]|uniref:RecB family exonuclease n=1 Tax=Speluncibacter jeojiensis TaxID=2710754 RepID=UPI0038CD29C5